MSRPSDARRPPAKKRPGATADRPEAKRKPTSIGLRRLRALALLVVVVAGVLYGVHRTNNDRASGDLTPAKAAVVHYSVGVADCTFVDPTRETHNYATGATVPGRRLVVEIRYPTISPLAGEASGESQAAHPAYHHGPFPLVVFANGYDTTPDEYHPLLDSWVRAGFVVAAPVFPDTNTAAVAAQDQAQASESDDVNQPGDVAFVLRELDTATASGSGCELMDDLINPDRVGLAGQSDGAATVVALTYETAYQVPGLHITATESLSGSLLYSPGPSIPNHETGSVPLLVVQSATDQCNLPQSSTQLYSAIPEQTKWFLTLTSGDHLPPYTDTADREDFAMVAAVTTRFFVLEFAHEQPGSKFFALDKTPPGVGKITTGAVPAITPLDFSGATCYES